MTTLWLPPANLQFIQALDAIADTQGHWAIIGGLAVWVHLGGAHRVTLDIDTAAGPLAHQTLVAASTPGNTSNQRIVAGAELEIIEVADPTGKLDHLDPKQRLFVASHWAAATRPITATIQCENITTIAPVANWLALLGCKLHAWLDRHSSQAAKRGSDGIDIIQLIRQQSGPPSTDAAPQGLIEWLNA